MKSVARWMLVVLTGIVSGCDQGGPPEAAVRREQNAAELELTKQLEPHLARIKAALGESGDYVQIAVIDRNYPIEIEEGKPEVYSRVLVLHREVLDLDDYGFSPPGKEASENPADSIAGFFGDLLFFVDKDARIILEDGPQPPGTTMVVEWCVPKSAGDEVSLHFGGNPCLVLDLRE